MSMTPEQRARAWYPSASIGGGNYDKKTKKALPASGVFLWKPSSDSNGKAAIHTPANVRVTSLTVAGKTYGVGAYGNGWRPLFRLDKQGSAYGSQVPVQMNLHGGGVLTILVPSGGKRFEKSGFKDTDSGPVAPPVKPPVATPAAVQSIILPPEYAAKVGLVAVLSGRKMHQCARDPANAARWTHAGKKASHIGIRWNVAPGGKVATYNAGPLGLWSVTDGARFLTLDEILGLLMGGSKPPASPPPVVPPVDQPKTPTPPAPARDATLTATGLRLAPDLVPLVAKVLILTHAETPAKTVKYQASRAGDEWSTGQPLSAYPSAVYQIFWAKEPRVPHHQGFPGAIKNVSHVMPSGAWNPPSTRNP